jgi:hypothetical protein
MRFASCLSLTLPMFVVLLAGCDCAGPPVSHACRSRSDCAGAQLCVDGICVAPTDSGLPPTDANGTDAPSQMDVGVDAPCAIACGAICCAMDEVCFDDTTCIPDRGTCASADECGDDTWCSPDGLCVPFGTPADHTTDDSCTRSIDIETIAPDVECRWTGPPAGDPFPDHYQVMSTPVVVDFDFDSDPATLRPSIVFTTFPTVGSYAAPGAIRVIDGGTCEHQFTLGAGGATAMSPAGPALGDLDGDGRAEIVAAASGGGLIAFAYDTTTSTFALAWRSGTCAPDGTRVNDTTGGTDRWAGPSIHDLDDDGVAEVIYGAVVYANDGCIRSSALGFPAYHRGVVPVVADVDEDGAMELVEGDAIYEWRTGAWVAETYVTGAGLSLGQVAVADLGNFPLASFGGEDRAEIVVVAAGFARVQTLEGTIVFGPTHIPGTGTGGAPTIADFDGDGRRELATAGGTFYTVFDLDCLPTGATGTCGTGRTDGVLWSQPSQDSSSNVTGSSVFDFDANGAAEAVYADECFLRVYDGATGNVVYSAARSSGTTYENPVIADVDGDFHSEIVSAVNDYAGTLGCPATDPLRAATTFSTAHGIVVLRDVMDRWAASRPVWNQHAYAVTHVGDHGEIPRSSLVAINWRDPLLNNFRQNVQGDLAALGVPDLTATAVSDRLRLPCDDMSRATLRARVCNRGALPMAAGFEVSFRAGAIDGAELCRASSPTFLGVGECDEIECLATIPHDEAIEVYVVTDPDGTSPECHEMNNWGLQPNVACSTVM